MNNIIVQDPDAQKPWKVFSQGPGFIFGLVVFLLLIRIILNPSVFHTISVVRFVLGTFVLCLILSFLELTRRIVRLDFEENEIRFYSSSFLRWGFGKTGSIKYSECSVKEWFYWKGKSNYSILFNSAQKKRFNISESVWDKDNYDSIKSEMTARLESGKCEYLPRSLNE